MDCRGDLFELFVQYYRIAVRSTLVVLADRLVNSTCNFYCTIHTSTYTYIYISEPPARLLRTLSVLPIHITKGGIHASRSYGTESSRPPLPWLTGGLAVPSSLRGGEMDITAKITRPMRHTK